MMKHMNTYDETWTCFVESSWVRNGLPGIVSTPANQREKGIEEDQAAENQANT